MGKTRLTEDTSTENEKEEETVTFQHGETDIRGKRICRKAVPHKVGYDLIERKRE